MVNDPCYCGREFRIPSFRSSRHVRFRGYTLRAVSFCASVSSLPIGGRTICLHRIDRNRSCISRIGCSVAALGGPYRAIRMDDLSVAPLRSRVRAWSSERTLYTTSLRSSPRSYILYQNLGVLNQEAGRAEGAIAYYTQALKLRPNAPTARRNLARLYLETGRLDDAAREFGELLKYVPSDLEAQINLGSVLLVQGESAQAVSLLREVVAKHPESYEAHMDLGSPFSA